MLPWAIDPLSAMSAPHSQREVVVGPDAAAVAVAKGEPP